MIHHCTDHTS